MKTNVYQEDITPTDDFHTAFTNWVEFHGYSGIVGMRDAHDSFCDFVGADWPRVGTIKLTDEQTRRVKLLAGPHWQTVIKAYYAKKD